MIYIFLPKAKEDFNEAIDHYNLEQPGLGLRFRDEIQKLIEAIVADPLLWRGRKGGFRRANCSVFPYYIAYSIRGEIIVILTVAHANRSPNFWKDRLR
jgi:plasmid stabilization system protein ParE